MSLIEIKKVETKKDLKTFIDFHYDLYEGNEYDVPNLFSDDMNTLEQGQERSVRVLRGRVFSCLQGRQAGRSRRCHYQS